MTLRMLPDCPRCGGGFPGDVPDEDVCKCGSEWYRKGIRRRDRQAAKAAAPRAALKRTAPLKQTGGLTRSAPIARASAVPAVAKKTNAKPRPKREGESNDIPAAVRAIVMARCQGMCEACGGTLEGGPVHMHHRKKRTKRNHVPCNIVALHPTCHVVAPLAVHQRPAWAQERGLIVLAGGDPAETPLRLANGDLVLLDPIEPRYLPARAVRPSYAQLVEEAS
jgi:hypothetical protein